MKDDLTPEQTAVIGKIQKLLNLAAKNPNPNEAEAAMAKAQKMLAEHNLDVATVEGKSDTSGKREEALVEGGFYAFQRELWGAVAELNFCAYWSQPYRAKERKHRWDAAGRLVDVEEKLIKRRRHALVGRVVNTRMTIAMAGYLQDAIERTLTQRLGTDPDVVNENSTSNWAWSFRKGAAAKIVQKLRDKRREHIAAEEEAARRAARAASGASTATGLTIASVSKSEEDANNDFRFGEGWSAARAAERAKAAARRRAMSEAYTKWAEANPKAARSEFEFEDDEGNTWTYGRDRSRYSGGRGSRGGKDGIDHSAYYAGYDAADKIGIDPQAEDRTTTTARIGR